MSAKLRWFYLHTIDGKPAFYEPGRQICYCYGRWARSPQPLASSLRQIRNEQARSRAWRIRQGYQVDNTEYDYVRVTLPIGVDALRRLRPSVGGGR